MKVLTVFAEVMNISVYSDIRVLPYNIYTYIYMRTQT